jgi:hypothetical protein
MRGGLADSSFPRAAWTSMNRKILIAASVLLFLAVASLGIMFFWPVPDAPPPPETRKPDPAATPLAASAPLVQRQLPMPSSSLPPPAGVVPLAAWEERLGEILTAPGDTTTAARALIAAIPGLPAEAQEQYIAHALNLCEDSDFSRVQEIYLRQGTPPAVAEAIFNDALNRPDEVKLPLLAKTMGIPNHPMAGEARGILELYLELEPDAPPPRGSWDVAVQDYLKKQQSP